MLLPLAPLSDAAICQLAQVPDHQAQRIALAVAGNPFLATELVRSGTAPGEPLPASIQALFGQYLGQVSTPCQQLLTCAATLPASFSLEDLSAVATSTMVAQQDWVLDLVEEALHAHLLTETVQDASLRYCFAPPLLQMALTRTKAAASGRSGNAGARLAAGSCTRVCLLLEATCHSPQRPATWLWNRRRISLRR